MAEEHASDLNSANDTFLLLGKIVPTYADGEWHYTEELYDTPQETRFPDDRLDLNEYIAGKDKVILLAYDGEANIGQIRLVRSWNKFAYIENIAVRRESRQSGLGRMLFEAGEQWAKEHSLQGVMLEAQDDNVTACRFYAKMGMKLGGVDTMRYAFNPNMDKALFWYKVF